MGREGGVDLAPGDCGSVSELRILIRGEARPPVDRLGHQRGEGLLALCMHARWRADAMLKRRVPAQTSRVQGRGGLGRRRARRADGALKSQIGYLDSEVNAHGCEMNVDMIYA
jgi:hypothetical protein